MQKETVEFTGSPLLTLLTWVSPTNLNQLPSLKWLPSEADGKIRAAHFSTPSRASLLTSFSLPLPSVALFHSINRSLLAAVGKGTVNTQRGLERGWAQRACCSQSPDETEVFTPAPDRQLTLADQQLPRVWSPPRRLTFHSGTFSDNIIRENNLPS